MDYEEIVACELAYISCFANGVNEGNIVRFRDYLLPDMYNNNCTVIVGEMDDKELYNCIENEIAIRKQESADFCNILLKGSCRNPLLEMFETKPDIARNGCLPVLL